MWLLDGGQDTAPPGTGWVCWAAGWLRVWHTQPVSRARVPGCRLLVDGHAVMDIKAVAKRLAAGEDTALGWLGGSATVIAVREHDVLVAGDLAGQRLVAVARHPRLVVGDQVSAVAGRVGAGFDPQWWALRLGAPQAVDVWWSGSPWAGVEVARPGWALHLERRSGTCSWRQITHLQPPQDDLVVAGHELREALINAVGTRAASARRLTADLSGGLDSATITALAATDSDSVEALTMLVPGVEDVVAARAVAALLPSVRLHELAVPEQAAPFADLDASGLDEPGIAANIGRERWWAQQIDEFGGGPHLTGEGGDAALTAPLSYLSGLTGLTAWRHARGWARLRQHSPAALVRAAWRLRRTSYADALRHEAHRIVHSGSPAAGLPARVSWFGSSTVEWLSPWARDTAAQLLRAHANAYEHPITPLNNAAVEDDAAWLVLIASGRMQRLYAQVHAEYGVQLESPWLDDAVVRACWRASAAARTTPYQLKPLLVRAMDGVVPDVALHRSTKGDYTASAYAGLRRHALRLRALFTGGRLAELGVIDEAALRATLARAADGLPVRLGRLDAVVGAEIWPRGRNSACGS